MLSKKEVTRIQNYLSKNYQNRVALIFFPARGVSYLSKEKFLVCSDTSFAQVMAEVRKYCPSDKTLHIVSEKTGYCPQMTKNMGELEEELAINARIICMLYSEESTFGGT